MQHATIITSNDHWIADIESELSSIPDLVEVYALYRLQRIKHLTSIWVAVANAERWRI
jgi:hypothetical protein